MMSIHPSICRTPFRASFREKRFARSRLAIATSHILTGLILTGAMVGAAAQAEEVYELGEVVVTAARTSQTVDETLAPVTVINRAQIERSQATDITELLKTVPGLQINRSGGPGSTTSVFMRGASSSQTLVLVDGQRINSATAGMAEFQYINPDQI
ncbi:MAG: TonB-dependent receptor, partial [Endozoicomonas sp.]